MKRGFIVQIVKKYKIIFIIPYYGELPSYFNIWVKSVSYNSNIDFLLITDLLGDIDLPHNIKIINWTFGELTEFMQKKFDFKICLQRPYKLCDFRSAYGYIFQDYIKEYDFWGYCDVDTVMGDLEKFLRPLIDYYDVIGKYGHMSLFRNEKIINECFMENNVPYSYREVFSNNENYAFDEGTGVKRIFQNTSYKIVYELNSIADISTAHKQFNMVHNNTNYEKQVFIFDKGKVFQCYSENGEVKYREFMYLHFQKKSPVISEEIKDSFYIMYDKFLPRMNKENDIEMLNKKKLYTYNFYKKTENIVWVVRKICRLLSYNKKQRRININKRKYQ